MSGVLDYVKSHDMLVLYDNTKKRPIPGVFRFLAQPSIKAKSYDQLRLLTAKRETVSDIAQGGTSALPICQWATLSQLVGVTTDTFVCNWVRVPALAHKPFSTLVVRAVAEIDRQGRDCETRFRFVL